MKITGVPFCTTDWDKVETTEHKGETGVAFWKTFEKGNIRVRKVEYSPGYLADHWCSKGHVILVLEGEMVTELKDGTKFTLTQGMSYQAEDDEINPHRTYSEKGVKLFIVD
jgi:quercetin dioxygenase-like cupin family protein